MRQHTVRFHGTITAIRQTKSGHTILQLDRAKEVMLVRFHESFVGDTTLRPFDNILYTETPAPTCMTFKNQTVKFNRPGVTIITVQMSDKTISDRNRRRKMTLQEEIDGAAAILASKPTAQDQVDSGLVKPRHGREA